MYHFLNFFFNISITKYFIFLNFIYYLREDFSGNLFSGLDLRRCDTSIFGLTTLSFISIHFFEVLKHAFFNLNRNELI